MIDFIVRHKTTGGNLSADLTNGITKSGMGDYQISSNYHDNKSEIKALFNWKRRDLDWIRSNTETFCTPAETFTNTEVGDKSKVKFDFLLFSLGYSRTFGKSLLSVTFRDRLNDMPNSTSDRRGTLYREGQAYKMADLMSSNDNSPSLDVYFQTELKKNHHLYLDLVGTYIGSNTDRTYSIQGNGTDETIRSATEGDKYSLIGEGIYEWTLGRSKLSFGLKHTQTYTGNRYGDELPAYVKMNTAETYAYGEFMSKAGKLTYTAGVGMMRTYNNQEGSKMEKYILRPSLTLGYDIAKNVYVRYNGYISGYSPSLSDLSNVSQDIDIYQTRRGNPNLKSVTFVSNAITLSWNTPKIGIQLFGRYSYDDKPIMEETLYEGGRFIRTTANQRGFHRLNANINIQARPFGDWLSLQVSPFVNRYISYGNTYTHTHTNWGLAGQALAMYKKWVFMAKINTSPHTLWGETLLKDEGGHTIAAGYNTDKWSVQLMIYNPFTKTYRKEKDVLSGIAPSRQTAVSKNFRQTLLPNVSFNINYGKNRRPSENRITNSDTDTGIMIGR